MKEKIGMTETVKVDKRIGCQRCKGELDFRENGWVCISCGGMHAQINGKWVYTGGGR